MNGTMWVLGGFLDDKGGDMSDVWSSSDGVTWTQVTDKAPWTKREAFAALAYDNKLWVMGGYGYSRAEFNDVWSSPDGKTWTQATAKAPWGVRWNFQGVVYGNKMWIMGGTSISLNSTFSDVWCSSDGTNWTLACDKAGWSAREAFKAVVYDNKIWVTGGNYCPKDVWYGESATGAIDGKHPVAAPGDLFRFVGPNPFRDNIQIRLLTSQTALAKISIFSGAGQKIAVVWTGGGAGERTATWDGLTNSGTVAPSGTYFVRCEAGGSAATRTIVKNDHAR